MRLFYTLAFCACVNVKGFESTVSVSSQEDHNDHEVVRSNADHQTVKRVEVAVGADGVVENLKAGMAEPHGPHRNRRKAVRDQAMHQQVIALDSNEEPDYKADYQDGARPTDSWCNPWCFIRLSPVLVLLKILMTWSLPAGAAAKLTATQRDERDKFWRLVSIVMCFCFSVTAAALMMFGLLSPPTAFLSLGFGLLFLYGLQQPATADDTSLVERERLYSIDNARWVAMVGIMVTHFYSSIYNSSDDGIVVHEFVVAVFVFCMGHQSTGHGFTAAKAMQPLIFYCVADFIWYWLRECGRWGDFDPLRPFMMNSTHFFSPLVNYSPGGYLWFLPCFVILKLTHEVLQRLIPERVLLRVILAHVLWVVGAFVTKCNYEYLMSLPGQNQALIYHTIMMPTIPIFAVGTVTTKEFIKGLENFRVRCTLAVVGLTILTLWAILPTMEYMKANWSSPTYVALVGYPMMLLQVLILISLVPHRPTAFSGLGARSLLLYILHPLAFELARNVYQDVFRKQYPWENMTWVDHQYDFQQLMVAWFSCIPLSVALGSEMIWWSAGLSKSSRKETSTQQQPAM